MIACVTQIWIKIYDFSLNKNLLKELEQMLKVRKIVRKYNLTYTVFLKDSNK